MPRPGTTKAGSPSRRDGSSSRRRGRKDKPGTRLAARQALLNYVDEVAFPSWSGTPWAFSGTTTTPREGAIACGYFVTTVLEQASFKLERVKLAQQASAYIVSTLARGTKVEWLKPKDPASALASMRRHFPDAKLLVVGFDLHVGFVRLEGERARFCHASYLEPGVMTCEEPVAAGAFASSLYVVGDALNDAVLDDWVLGRDVPSVLPKRSTPRG